MIEEQGQPCSFTLSHHVYRPSDSGHRSPRDTKKQIYSENRSVFLFSMELLYDHSPYWARAFQRSSIKLLARFCRIFSCKGWGITS